MSIEPCAVDVLVVEFQPEQAAFPGELAAEIASLVENGMVRIVGLFVVSTDELGRVRVSGRGDLDDVAELDGIPHAPSGAVSGPYVEELASSLPRGATAGVIVWEHLWAAPFGEAVRRSGGQVVHSGRMPPEVLARGA